MDFEIRGIEGLTLKHATLELHLPIFFTSRELNIYVIQTTNNLIYTLAKIIISSFRIYRLFSYFLLLQTLYRLFVQANLHLFLFLPPKRNVSITSF